jgi:hypothetical protein
MKFVSAISILIIMYLSTVHAFGQNVITFDNQGWNSNQILPSNFLIGSYSFSGNEVFYTNYGNNFDVNSNSLYYVFQSTNTDKITITTSNGLPFKLISLAAFQVSETSTDSLVIEGWNGSNLEYTRSFLNDTSWETLTLNYNNIDKVVIRVDSAGNGGLADYNFDNITFSPAVSPAGVTADLTPNNYSLSQNYPNPFNPSTTINYSIAKASKVVLKIYDLLGKEVSTLVDGNKAAGRYSVTFNASNLPSGIYIYMLKSDGFASNNKMILLK